MNIVEVAVETALQDRVVWRDRRAKDRLIAGGVLPNEFAGLRPNRDKCVARRKVQRALIVRKCGPLRIVIRLLPNDTARAIERVDRGGSAEIDDARRRDGDAVGRIAGARAGLKAPS